MPQPRPHVLLTNDDGVHAPGLRALSEALRASADLTIVAPSHENSGMGHAITVFRDLHFEPVHEDGQLWGWGLNGTPADCVKVAIHLLGRDRPFDAVISGVNRGQNAGINVLYSGTVAAAREAAIYGLPAIAVSLLYLEENHLPYHTGGRVAADVLNLMLRHGLPRGVMLNVNVPPVEYENLRGWAVTRMGDSGYDDFFEMTGEPAEIANRESLPVQTPGVAKQMNAEPRAENPADQPEVSDSAEGDSGQSLLRAISTPTLDFSGAATFRNVGSGWNPSRERAADLDDHAIYQERVSITPLHFDLTAYQFLPELARWWSDGEK
jgi:5'-nucleotidase